MRPGARPRATIPPVRLVVDTDTGVDDALALLVLAADPEVELVAVTTTHGNTTTEQATANARRVLEVAGLAHVPVTGGLSGPLAGELDVAWFVHGRDGLGDCGEAPPPAPPAEPGKTAVEALLDLAHRHAGELDLLALGPLTNLGAALRVDPEVLAAFRSVTVMGGVGPRRGEGEPDPTGGIGDPNTYHDAEAARLVAAASGQRTFVGVDVTLTAVTGPAGLERLAAATTDHGRFANRICRFYVDFYERAYGRRDLTLHDPLAALAATGRVPGASYVEGTPVVVGEAGEERLVLDPPTDGPPSARALVACDAAAVADHVLGALERPLPVR